MKLTAQLTEQELRKLVADHLAEKTGQTIDPSAVTIEVKTTQNYRAEWERGNFRASLVVDV